MIYPHFFSNRIQKVAGLFGFPLFLVTASLVLSGTSHSIAGVVYDSSGFESPRFFATESLAGQDPVPPPVSYGPWHQDLGTSTAVVQTDIPNGGLQSIKVTRVAGAGGDTRWGINVPITPNAVSNVVAIDFDLNATISPGTVWGGPELGPLFGIECYDTSSGTPKLIGSVFLDAYAGDVVYQQAGTGYLEVSGTFIPRNQYHHYTLAANFITKTYQISVDGMVVHTEGFVDPTATAFNDAPITVLAATADSAATATGTAFFDNYVISATTSLLNNLVWQGDGVTNVWDVGTSGNWFNGNGLAVFSNNVPVVFDDTGTNTPAINVHGTVQPASIIIKAAQSYSFGGTGNISGGGGLLKLGNGTLTLSGNNSYTGGTTVSNGTLLVNNPSGSATGSGSVNIEPGATLTGSGSIGGAVTIDDSGILAPGNNTGTLTINGNLTLVGDAVLQYALGTTGSHVNINGNLTLSGVLNFSDAGGFGPGTYTLLNYSGALSGPGLFIYQSPSGFIYTIDTNTAGAVNLIVANASALAGAPVGLSATPVSSSQINLAWMSPSTNVTAFLVERSLDDYVFTQIAATTGNATNYSDTGLAPNTTYYYRVRAGNSGGDSPYSITVAASTSSSIYTTNGTWIATANGNWNSGSNWLNAAIAFSSGGSADFSTLALSSNVTVTLDAPVSINILKFGDRSATYNWSLTGNNSLNLGSSPNINVVNQSVTISAPLTSQAGLAKSGPGNLTLGGTTNPLSGGVTLNSGSLTLDFTLPSSPAADIIPPTNGLTLGGAALQIVGNNSAANSQTVASITLNEGASVIAAAPGSGTNNPTVNLAAFTTKPGGVVEFIGPATIGAGSSNVAATATITTSTAGFVGSSGDPFFDAIYATVGLYDFATTNLLTTNVIGGSQVIGFYTPGSGTTVVGTEGDAPNLDVVGNISGWAAQVSLLSMRFNTSLGSNQTVAVTYTGGNVLTIGDILVTPNVGSYNVTYNGGVFRPGGGNSSVGGPLVIWQNNSAGELILNSLLGNSKAGSAAYVQSGPGTVSITGTGNLYTGQNYLNGGVTLIAGDGSIGSAGTGAAVNLNGGTLAAAGTFALDNGGPGRSINVGNNGGGLAVTAGNTFTVDGLIGSAAGAGPLTIGIPASSANNNTAGLLPGTANSTPVQATGTVILNNANYYTGGTILQSGTLNINGINALGGANYGGLTINGGTLQYASSVNNGSADLTAIGTAGITLSAGGGTIDLNGNNVTYAGSLGNGGYGALTVENSQGNGSLTLWNDNAYAGNTTVTNATLLVENPGGSATGSGDVAVQNNGVLTGTGSLAGSVAVNQGGMLMPGDPLGNLTIGQNLTLNSGSTTLFQIQHSPLFNSTVSLPGSLMEGGTLIVTNMGADALAKGDVFLLFNAGTYSGGFANIVLPPLPANLMWNTNQLVASGVLSVISLPSVAVAVTAQVQGGKVMLTGTGGPADWPCYVLSTTNLNLPPAQWTRETTNHFDSYGNFNYTNTVDPQAPDKFFRLQLQ